MNDQRQQQQHRLQEWPGERRERQEAPCLTFSPAAYLKLQFFLHAGETEVGGFGVCHLEDPLYVTDFRTVKQFTTAVSVEFDDESVAEHFDRCVDGGLVPQQFARVWIHTHPGASPDPSLVDERTFARVFGRCDWACMFIIGRTGRTYARLQFTAGPAASLLIPVAVDWAAWAQLLTDRQEEVGSIVEGWMDEYGSNIYPREQLGVSRGRSFSSRLVHRLLLETDDLVRLNDEQLVAEQIVEEQEWGWGEGFRDAD